MRSLETRQLVNIRGEWTLVRIESGESPPIIGIVIGEIEFPGRSVIPGVRDRQKRIGDARYFAHISVPSIELVWDYSLGPRLEEAFRLVPHAVEAGRIVADESSIIVPREGILGEREGEEDHQDYDKKAQDRAHRISFESNLDRLSEIIPKNIALCQLVKTDI